MSDKPSITPPENAASAATAASSNAFVARGASATAPAASVAKKIPEQNPALKAMG
jgi:hypothetical protein